MGLFKRKKTRKSALFAEFWEQNRTESWDYKQLQELSLKAEQMRATAAYCGQELSLDERIDAAEHAMGELQESLQTRAHLLRQHFIHAADRPNIIVTVDPVEEYSVRFSVQSGDQQIQCGYQVLKAAYDLFVQPETIQHPYKWNKVLTTLDGGDEIKVGKYYGSVLRDRRDDWQFEFLRTNGTKGTREQERWPCTVERIQRLAASPVDVQIRFGTESLTKELRHYTATARRGKD